MKKKEFKTYKHLLKLACGDGKHKIYYVTISAK